jgi:hypothetical protein
MDIERKEKLKEIFMLLAEKTINALEKEKGDKLSKKLKN